VAASGPLGAALLLASGVSVLTAAHDGVVHGVTVSSASLFSRNPPVVSAALRHGSLLTKLALESGRFAVNVLSERQALLADWFANPRRAAGIDQFALIDWKADASTGIPLLRNTRASLTCQVSERIQIRGHDLLLATVEDGSIGVGRPLLNFDGTLCGAEFYAVTRRSNWQDSASASITTLE
jgi:flavin reductase (DIM6/NTAB) family NADH-FMN oxidoreductase RutF